ncbi:MAG: hypothetical protein AAB337_01780 [Patescibacteria group bacterium]
MPFFAITFDLSGIEALLARPDILLTNLLVYVGWIPIFGVLVWGFLEVWLHHRQEHYRLHQNYVLLAIDAPKMTEQSPMAMEHVFATIAAVWGGPNFREKWIDGEVSPIFSFELVSIGGYIQFFVRVPKKYRDLVEAGLYSAYPDIEITEAEDYATSAPDKYPDENYRAWGCELKLKNDNHFPIRTYQMFEHRLSQELKDTIGLTLEQYAKLKPGEQLWTQIIVQNDPEQHWVKVGVKYINETIGKPEKNAHKTSVFGGVVSGLKSLSEQVAFQAIGFGGGEHAEEKKEDPWKFLRSTPLDKVRLDLVSQKIGKPGCRVKIRHVYIAKHASWNKSARDKMLKGVFYQFAHLDSNAFGRVKSVNPKDDYFWQKWFKEIRATNVVRAYKKRDGERGGKPFILNTEELATLWHMPSILVLAPSVKKTLAKRAEPPVQLEIADELTPDIMTPARLQHVLEILPVEVVEPRLPAMVRKVEKVERHEKVEKPKALDAQRTVVKPKEIPDVLRVLLDPDVELEDVGLSDPPQSRDAI